MNKSELVDAISQKTNVSKKEADAILTAMIEEIVAAVASGNKVTLVGFGSLSRANVKRVKGVTPKQVQQ